jgi:hypothetical protein
MVSRPTLAHGAVRLIQLDRRCNRVPAGAGEGFQDLRRWFQWSAAGGIAQGYEAVGHHPRDLVCWKLERPAGVGISVVSSATAKRPSSCVVLAFNRCPKRSLDIAPIRNASVCGCASTERQRYGLAMTYELQLVPRHQMLRQALDAIRILLAKGAHEFYLVLSLAKAELDEPQRATNVEHGERMDPHFRRVARVEPLEERA